MSKKRMRRTRRKPSRAQRTVNLQWVWAFVTATLAIGLGLLSDTIWKPKETPTIAGTYASLMGKEFSLAVANQSGIQFGRLQPLGESDEMVGWRQTQAEKTELTALSGDELIRRLVAVKPEREVLKQYFGYPFRSGDISPLTRTDKEIILIPQVHIDGGVDLSRGDRPSQYALACQIEIARFLIRQRQRGRFALVVEGHSSPMVTQSALVAEMHRAGQHNWDKTMVPWCGATIFGLNHTDVPMASEGQIAEVTRALWGQSDPRQVERDPVFEMYNNYRDRVFAATAVSLGSYTKLPVFVVAGGGHMNGIQYQLQRWQFKCRSWLPAAYREYVGGRP